MFRLAWAMHDCVLLISVLPRPFENDPLPAIDESDKTYGEHIGYAYMRSFSNPGLIDDTQTMRQNTSMCYVDKWPREASRFLLTSIASLSNRHSGFSQLTSEQIYSHLVFFCSF